VKYANFIFKVQIVFEKMPTLLTSDVVVTHDHCSAQTLKFYKSNQNYDFALRETIFCYQEIMRMWNGDLDTHDDGLMVDASRFPRKSATRQHTFVLFKTKVKLVF
jgi:hypothetical protein